MKRVWMELNRVKNLVSSYYFVKILSLRCGHSSKISTKFCRQKWSIVYCHTKFLITWIHIKRTREKSLSNQAIFCWWTHQISVINLNMSDICVGNSKFPTTQISTEITVNVKWPQEPWPLQDLLKPSSLHTVLSRDTQLHSHISELRYHDIISCCVPSRGDHSDKYLSKLWRQEWQITLTHRHTHTLSSH